MRSVKVNTSDLLKVLQENYEIHANEFKQLRAKYLDALQDVLESALADISTNVMPVILMPEQPKSHVADYEQAIKMAKMSTEGVIELTEHEFSQLVMDNWDWKHKFEMTKTAYGV
jgi:hypothetical protein